MLWMPGFRKKLLSDRRKLGRWGERRCEKFLKKLGYSFIARNFRCKYGEIDLIFANLKISPPELVFVEVKTRSSEKRYKAQQAVNRQKRRHIGYTAKVFMQKYRIKDKRPRYDIVAVILPRKGRPTIRHYESAFIP